MFRILQWRCSFGKGSLTTLVRFGRSSPSLAIFLAAVTFAMVGPVFSPPGVVNASNSMQLANSVLTVGSVEVLPDQLASSPVVLSDAPNGLSGFVLEFTVIDSSVGELVSVSLPDFGLTQTELISGSKLVVKAADLNGLIVAGDANVTLATIEILGVSSGSTQIEVSVLAMDDDKGNNLAVEINQGTIMVANVAPIVDAGPDVVSDEGQTFVSAGSFADSGIDTWNATVDYGDGTVPQALSLNGQLFELSHIYSEDGSYTVSITVTDGGGLSGVGTAIITVNNVAPDVFLPGDVTLDDGFTYSGEGSFADPGADTWTGVVDYGDGTGVQSLTLNGKAILLSHSYSDYGVYDVTVTVTDDESGVGTDSFQVEVKHVCPWLAGSPNPSLDNDADLKCEDVNGNGRLDFSDLVRFFQSLDAPEVLDNAEDFDFNDNGVIDMADVIALFEMITG